MNYDVVCESCNAAVLTAAPHIGDPEASALAKHLRDHHSERVDPERRTPFPELVREFRLQKAEAR